MKSFGKHMFINIYIPPNEVPLSFYENITF